MYKLSPSSVGLLLECPRCLWLEANENVKRPRGIFPSLPSGMDEVFKRAFDVYRRKGTLPPEIVGKVKGKLFADMKQLNIWRNIHFGRGGLVATFPEYNIVLRGAIDELVVEPDGAFALLDFKTRGFPTKEDTHTHYQHQLDLYALSFERNKIPIAQNGYLLFFWPEEYVRGSVRFKTELVRLAIHPENGRAILKDVHAIISGKLPKAHARCAYCLYRTSFDG